jgi:amicoumacin kinase
MEKIIDQLMTDSLLNQLLQLYGLEKEVKKLGDFENYVYETCKGGEAFILRITHNSHRSSDDIASELDWMKHLHQSGISVPEVFQSMNGLLVETLRAEDGSEFYGCLYSKAAGEPVSVRSDNFDAHLFKAWGETIAVMHQATKLYKPADGIKSRNSWDQDELLEVEKYYPAEDFQLVKNAKDLLEHINKLPKDLNTYGLIHTDIHSGNFFFDGEKVHVFDFDDASYHWFVSDIAIPLFYSIFYKIPPENQEERQQFADYFMTAFMEGYENKNRLPDGWKAQLPLFLRLRDVVLYAVLHKKIAPEDRGERLLAMMEELRDRIKNKRPIVNIN